MDKQLFTFHSVVTNKETGAMWYGFLQPEPTRVGLWFGVTAGVVFRLEFTFELGAPQPAELEVLPDESVGPGPFQLLVQALVDARLDGIIDILPSRAPSVDAKGAQDVS